MTGYPLSTVLTGVFFLSLCHIVNNFLSLSAVATGVVCFVVGFNLNKVVNAVEEKKRREQIVPDNCLEPANVEKDNTKSNEDEKEVIPLKDDETEEPLVEAPEDTAMNGFLLSGKFRSPLINILNQADPVSFVRMASTCRSLRRFCLNSREISVKFPCRIVFVKSWNHTVEGIRFKYLKGNEGYLTVYGAMLRKLIKLPFHFEIYAKFRDILYMDSEHVTAMESYINQFPSFTIRKLYVNEEGDIHCWPQLFKFIQDYGVKSLNARDEEIFIDFEVVRSIVLTKFDKLKLATKIPQGMLSKLGARVAHIARSDVTAEDFMDLLQAIGRGEITHIDEWHFEHLNDNFNAESFVACFNGFKKIAFSHEGSLPADRPLVALKDNNDNRIKKYFILTGQHNVIGFTHYATTKTLAVFTVDESPWKHGPRAFLQFSQ